MRRHNLTEAPLAPRLLALRAILALDLTGSGFCRGQFLG